jgi:hypothetical protein
MTPSSRWIIHSRTTTPSVSRQCPVVEASENRRRSVDQGVAPRSSMPMKAKSRECLLVVMTGFGDRPFLVFQTLYENFPMSSASHSSASPSISHRWARNSSIPRRRGRHRSDGRVRNHNAGQAVGPSRIPGLDSALAIATGQRILERGGSPSRAAGSHAAHRTGRSPFGEVAVWSASVAHRGPAFDGAPRHHGSG